MGFAAGHIDGNAVRRRLFTSSRARTVRPTLNARSPRDGGDQDPLGEHLGPLFACAPEIAIVTAFVTNGGLALLAPWIVAALRAGAELRLVTGDYLAFTRVDALWQRLDWSQRDALDGPPASGH